MPDDTPQAGPDLPLVAGVPARRPAPVQGPMPSREQRGAERGARPANDTAKAQAVREE